MAELKSDLAIKVEKALTSDSRTKDSAIEVIDNNGVVTLKGMAATDEQRSAAEDVASSQDGVISVINDLELRTSGTSDAAVNATRRIPKQPQ